MKIVKAQFASCNSIFAQLQQLSFSCAICLGIAMLWPRNEENTASLWCEISKVLVPRWQCQCSSQNYSGRPHSIFYHICLLRWRLCSLCHSAHVCAAGDEQAVTPACPGCVPSQAGAFPAAQPAGPWPRGRDGDPHQRAESLCVLTGEVPTAGCGFTATTRWIPMGKNNSYVAHSAPDKWLWQPSVLQAENGNVLLLWNRAVSQAHCSFGPSTPCKGGRNPGEQTRPWHNSNIKGVWGMGAGAGDLGWV